MCEIIGMITEIVSNQYHLLALIRKVIALQRLFNFCDYSHSKVLRIIPIKQHLRGALYCILDAEISRFSVVNRKSVVRSVVNDCLCFLHRVGELEESDTVH